MWLKLEEDEGGHDVAMWLAYDGTKNVDYRMFNVKAS